MLSHSIKAIMQATQSTFYTSTFLHRQRGVLLLEAMVYIMFVALLAIWGASYTLKQIEDHGMESTAVYMTILKTGLEKYNATNRDELAAGLSVKQPACGPTPRAGAQIINPLAPSVAELVAGLCISAPGFPATTPQNQGVATKIELQGCPGVSCRLFATAYTTTPLQTRGNDRYDLVAAYLQASKGSGAASQSGDEGFLRSPYMRTANPVLGSGGTPAGAVLAIGTYFDEGIYANFVKLNDVRPINLNNTLTVAGDITGKNNIGTNDGVAACFRAALTNGGQVIARASDCLARVILDGNTGNVTSYDATGRNAAGIRYAGNSSTLYADNLQNNNNTAGIRADGTVYGVTGAFGTVNISNSAVLGGACTTNNDMVRTTIGGNPALLTCVGGVWRLTGGTAGGASGGACSVAGAPGITASGVGLICVNGVWATNSDRFGRFAATDNYDNVTDGTIIAKPSCAANGVPKIYFTPQGMTNVEFKLSATISQYVSNFRASETATTFVVVIDDTVNYGVAKGNPLPDSYAMAITGCYYN
jgi:hypothetical protein